MKKSPFFLLILFLTFILNLSGQEAGRGEIEVKGKEGAKIDCPLKDTKVDVEISGFVSRVRVTQVFENRVKDKASAVYSYALPAQTTVNDLVMKIGERTFRGKVMKRSEAQEYYEAPKSFGKVAGLADRDYRDTFVQALPDISPGEKIEIEISYIELLRYEAGAYEFVLPFPKATPKAGAAVSPDKQAQTKTEKHPANQPLKSNILLDIRLDSGIAIDSPVSPSHEIEVSRVSSSGYSIKLKGQPQPQPEKDFVLRYNAAGGKTGNLLFTHRNRNDGFFALLLQPPDPSKDEEKEQEKGEAKPKESDATPATPKEIVFILDTSSSMDGFPIEKSKEAINLALAGLNPSDTFNLITFAGDTNILFPAPVKATPDNLAKAKAFLKERRGGGSTEMMKAVKAALDPSDSQQHLRIACFMTDGVVENENKIIEEIRKHPKARVFAFGIGHSVNREFIARMAQEGQGEAEIITEEAIGSAAAKRFHERVRSPLLTEISIDFGDLEVADVYPKKIADFFSAKPLIIYGRYTAPGSGIIRIRGKSFGKETVKEIKVDFPAKARENEALLTLWAGTRLKELIATGDNNAEGPEHSQKNRDEIASFASEFDLMSDATSFLALEEITSEYGGRRFRALAPAELPEGKNPEIFKTNRREGPKESFGKSGILTPDFVLSGDPLSYMGEFEIGNRKRGNLNEGLGISYKGIESARGRPVTTLIGGRYITEGGTTLQIGNEKRHTDINIMAYALPNMKLPPESGPAGEARIEVSIDAAGKVVSAKALSGDPAYQQALESLAKNAKFKLPKLPLEIIKANGTISYFYDRYSSSMKGAEYLQNAIIEAKYSKYHSAIKQYLESAKNGREEEIANYGFIKNGYAEVVFAAKELKPELTLELYKIGFEIIAEKQGSNLVAGKIAPENLAKLGELEEILFICPQMK